MKRINKKGFTLVELLAAIVILAVLMLVGAQAVGTILNNSNANSLVNSLDMAVKQATMKYAEGTLETCPTADELDDVLTYDKSQYMIKACFSDKGYIYVRIEPQDDGKFKNTKCKHGNITTLEEKHSLIGTTKKDKKLYSFECYDIGDEFIITETGEKSTAEYMNIVRRVDISNITK